VTSIYRSAAGENAVRERYQQFLRYWPIPNQHLRVPTREGETFVVACGAEGASPLLLFHGSGANSTMWMGDVAAWAPHFRIYAIDMIGEPGLSAQSRPPLASAAYALWLDDVLQALALTRVSMVGVSLGGWLALDYATRYPERVRSAVVLCPGGVGRQRNFRFKALPLLMLGRWGRLKAMRRALGPLPKGAPVNQNFANFVTLIFENLRPRRTKLPIFSDQALKRLTMPVMLIAGGLDALLDSADSKRRLKASASRLTVRFLPDRGHLITGQTAAILRFLLATEDANANG
jgi:pimeloyl-ACP methyl ester carboxylesterase